MPPTPTLSSDVLFKLMPIFGSHAGAFGCSQVSLHRTKGPRTAEGGRTWVVSIACTKSKIWVPLSRSLTEAHEHLFCCSGQTRQYNKAGKTALNDAVAQVGRYAEAYCPAPAITPKRLDETNHDPPDER
jgi:hypothetical protein